MYILACLITIFGSAIILWVIGTLIYLRLNNEVLFRRLKSRHRVLDWKDVEAHLAEGPGTLIIEQRNQIGARFWWTPDDLVAIAPTPIRDLEGLGYDYIIGKSSNPFVAWCSANYLSIKTGKAFFTHLERSSFPPGPVESDFFLNLYPNAKIVQTVLTRLSG